MYILSAINNKLLCFAVAFFTKVNNAAKQKRQLLKPSQDASQVSHHIKKADASHPPLSSFVH